MKCFIIDTLEGIFALDEGANIINFRDFNDDYKRIFQFYDSTENKIITKDYEEFIVELKNSGFDEFIFDNSDLESLSSENMGFQTRLEISSLEFKNFRLDLVNQLKKIGISKTRNDLLIKYKTINEELIKRKVSEVSAQYDTIIIQIIETVDIIKKSINLFSARLKEWYGLYFPELTDKDVEDNVLLAKMVSVLGKRENYTIDKISENFTFNDEFIKDLVRKASESMGADIDLKAIQGYANQILSLDSYMQELEEYLETLMQKSAPNLNSIVGPLVGAKLIAKAGSLKKLAYMPASRIQLLGAEKALYRFLKTGEKRPKHGLIFQWKQIRGSKPYLRGKISRIISGKIGLASKVDYFSGDFIGDVFSKEIEEKIKEIEEKYPKPPKKNGDGKTSKPRKSQQKKKK